MQLRLGTLSWSRVAPRRWSEWGVLLLLPFCVACLVCFGYLHSRVPRPRERMTIVVPSGGHGCAFLAFSSSGDSLITRYRDGTVSVWDVTTGGPKSVLTGPEGIHRGVTFSPQSWLLARPSGDKTVSLWNVKSGKECGIITSDAGGVFPVALSPDGRTLATADEHYNIYIWDVASRRLRYSRRVPAWPLESDFMLWMGAPVFAFSPDGSLLAIGRPAPGILIWDVATGAERASFHTDPGMVYLTFSPAGERLVSVHKDRKARLWNLTSGTGQIIGNERLLPYPWGTPPVAFSPDGKKLAMATVWGALLIDLLTGKPECTLECREGIVTSVTFSSDGRTLAAVISGSSGSDLIRFWDMPPGEQ